MWDKSGSVARIMGLSSVYKISICLQGYYAFSEIFRQCASIDDRRAGCVVVAALNFATTTQSIPLSKSLFNRKDSLICLLIRFLTTAFFDTFLETAIPSLAYPSLFAQQTTRKYFPCLRGPLENTCPKSAELSSLLDLSKASDTKASYIRR